MLKRNFSPPATLYQAALEPKPLTPLNIPFQETLPDNVCHLVDTVRTFSEELAMFLRTTMSPCVQLAPDSSLVSFTEALVTIHNKHSKLLKELQELPPETPLSDSRITKMTHVALNGMDSTHSGYSQGLVDACILINDLSGRLSGRVLKAQEVMARLVAPLDIAAKLEVVARRRQSLMEIIELAKSRMLAHAEVQALEAQLYDAGTPIRLSDKPRVIQLQTTFDLTNFRWLGKTRYFQDSPRRIQVVLFNDRVLVMTPKNEALLVWSRVEDLRAIPFNPRTSDPLVAFRVFSPCQAEKDKWIERLDSIIHHPDTPEDPDAQSACVFSMIEEPLEIEGENMRQSYSMPCQARPLVASVIERSTTDPIKNIVSSETPSLCTEESRSSDSSESSLVNSPAFSSSTFRVGLANRSSSTLETASKEGVCRFLSKPCHLLLNVERGEEWTLSGVVSVEVRRLNDGTSRLFATSTRSQRTLLRMPVVAGIEVRKSSSSNVEIVDQRAIAYRFLMDDVSEADELLAILSEEIQPRPSSPPKHPINKSMASLSEAPDPKATRLASVTCKLFILRNSDHTWSKAGQSLLELFQQNIKSDVKPDPTMEAHKSTPDVFLLVRCLDSTRKIHFPPGSFRCERIAPLKLLIVHLDHHHHTTTIMLQLKSKQVVESLIAWLIC